MPSPDLAGSLALDLDSIEAPSAVLPIQAGADRPPVSNRLPRLVSPWLISAAVHFVFLLMLALWVLPYLARQGVPSLIAALDADALELDNAASESYDASFSALSADSSEA